MIGPRLIFHIFLETTKVMELATLGQPVLILEPEILICIPMPCSFSLH